MNEGSGFDVEEKNFENMVLFNKNKLLQIIKGKSAYKLSSARKRLRDTGILVFENDVTGLVVSEKAFLVLSREE